jgi:hypothetical protein
VGVDARAWGRKLSCALSFVPELDGFNNDRVLAKQRNQNGNNSKQTVAYNKGFQFDLTYHKLTVSLEH